MGQPDTAPRADQQHSHPLCNPEHTTHPPARGPGPVVRAPRATPDTGPGAGEDKQLHNRKIV